MSARAIDIGALVLAVYAVGFVLVVFRILFGPMP